MNRSGRAWFWLALLASGLGLLIVCQDAEAQLPRPIYPGESALNHVGIQKWAKFARIGRTVTVATTRGDYTSLGAAVTYVTSQTPSAVAPWTILVYDGDHSAAPVALPAWVSVVFLGGIDDDGDRSGLAVRTGAGYTFGLKVNGAEVTGGAGGAGNSFETINAPAGTDPVAESATDTLNLTCTGLTCTGTAATDTIAIAIAADGVALGTDTSGGYAASVSEAGPATTATALAANGANCSAGSWSAGVDASGASEGCTADDDTPEAAEFGALALTGPVTSSGLATTIAADAVALGTQTTGGYAASATEGGAASSVAANSVALTTDTTGSYVSTATASQGLTVTGTEGASVGLQDCAASELLKRNAGDTAWECSEDGGGGVTDHGALTGLGDDDHSIYALLAGRSGGQTLTGGAGATDPLILKSTASGTKGQVRVGDGTTFPALFQQLAADTTMTQLLVNRATAVDGEVVHISGPGSASAELLIRDASSGPSGPSVKIDRTTVPGGANQSVGSVNFCGANACYNEIGVKSTAAWSGAGPSYFYVKVGDAAGGANEVFRAANAEAGGAQVVAGGALASTVKVGGTLNTSTTQTGNTAATETDLYTFSVPASALLTNGDSLHLECGGTFAGSITTDKRLRVKYGAATLFDSGALSITSASSWKIQADVLRTGAATQKGSVEFHSSSSVLAASAGYATAAETLSGAVTIKITGQGTDASDVVNEWCKLQWRP